MEFMGISAVIKLLNSGFVYTLVINIYLNASIKTASKSIIKTSPI